MPTGQLQDVDVFEDELLKHKLNLLSCVSAFEEHTRILKQAQESLRESEETIRALLENASQGIITIDASGTIVQTNAMALRLFGYSREELVASSIERLLPDTEWHFQTSTQGPIGIPIESVAHRKDGSQFSVEISFGQASTRRGLLVTAFLCDITQRKQDENALRESEETTRALLEAASHAIIVADQAGRIVIANPMAEKLFGYERDELFQLPLDTLLPEGVKERDFLDRENLLHETRTGPLAVGLELTALRKDGSEIPVEVNPCYLNTKRGRFVASFIMDITARKQARETLLQQAKDLARSNGDLEQFTYSTSHDLQEPLRMISTYAQLIEERYREQLDSSGKQYIDYMVEGVRRMEALIDDILAFSRVVHTDRSPSSPVPLDSAIDWAIKNLHMAIQRTGAAVVFEALPVVNGNQMELVQLFQNLIGNAIKHRSPDRRPQVHIEAERRDAEWVVAVRDNGAGIEPEYYDRIFGLFKRLSRDTPGSGLGLAICKKIAEKHQGRIWVESKAGIGSTFYVALPAVGSADLEEVPK